MASVFSKLINGELPCYKIDETDSTVSILALHQTQRGHTLVIPKREVDFWFELDDSEYIDVMMMAKRLGPAIKKMSECARVGTTVVGFEVPHFHLHLIPMWGPADMSFANAKILSESEMSDIQSQIISNLKG